MGIDEQIAFIDEMIAHCGNAEELEALEAVRKSLVGLIPPSPGGHCPKGETTRTGKARKKTITLERYQEFVGVYDAFCRKMLGAPGVIDARQGLALKEVVSYLMKQEKVNGDELQALEAWKYILNKWSDQDDFIQKQTKLSDIKRNIQEILFRLRNASKEAKRRKSDNDWNQYRKLRQGE